ncbi:hypothetical protein [Roseovarius phycicola]|uniref:Uncharacterized protein n=1 Tax=Roseovarius phycicola TaxID=3080976 RepID=A0ABZ2HHA9_9RHOB
MLDLLGTIGSNFLSLPGVLGLAFGMMTRNIGLAVVMGGLIGLGEALMFADFSFAQVGGLELAASIGIGMIAGSLGCMIRRKGATV